MQAEAVKFSHYRILNATNKSLSPLLRLTTNFLKVKEGLHGNSHMQLVQDSALLWLPKVIIARSGVEFFETTLLELTESLCFYYIAPFVAGGVLMPLFRRAASKGRPFRYDDLAESVDQLTDKKLLKEASFSRAARHILPAKLGLAVASIAVAASVDYGLNFVKNIVTEKGFKQTDFAAIVGLNKHSVETDTSVTPKALRRIVQSALAGGAVVAGALAFARWGSLLPKALQTQTAKLAKWLDFDFKMAYQPKTGKAIRNQFDLAENQLKVVMPIAILSYWDSARDELEKVEVICRDTIICGYIGYIQPWVARKFNQVYGRRYRHLGLFTDKKYNEVKNYKQLQDESIQNAKRLLKLSGKTLTPEAIERVSQQRLKPKLVAKAKLFAFPFVFGIVGVGLSTSWLNQVWTKRRFEKMKEQNAVKQH